MNNQKLKIQLHLKQMISHLKPRRRKLFRQKDTCTLKSNIPTLKEADKVEHKLTALHKRLKSRKKQQLFDLFADNINMFCRLNKQRSTYEQLFSKNKQNVQPKKRLKRCTSAHVNRNRTFQQPNNYRDSGSRLKINRPFSSYSTKNHRKILTIQSQT